MVRAVIVASFEDVERQQTSSSSLNMVWGTPRQITQQDSFGMASNQNEISCLAGRVMLVRIVLHT